MLQDGCSSEEALERVGYSGRRQAALGLVVAAVEGTRVVVGIVVAGIVVAIDPDESVAIAAALPIAGSPQATIAIE